ncbi:MAG: 5'-nucleotidase, lipoprotein e(P4) family [Rhodospirillales bacterium]|jgi:5'-nucleotidase (lipoprotein e(P4) family)|nr:5'-nucleotidase, lipoprotein e(P4) family [Rhodospirillales bacterium]
MRKILFVGLAAAIAASPAMAADVKPNDNLNSTYWTQNSIEFKANALAAYQLATLQLDQALADKNWTAAPVEQTGNYQGLPPAVILDVDETVLDNSMFQAWMVLNDKTFSSKTWGPFVNSVTSRVIPGSLAFTKYADSKGVKVFYVSNRTGDLEEATRKNLEKFGYPMGGNVDTVLLKKERKEWASSKKGVRRAHVTKDYRVLLLIGDNFGDFVDGYKGSPKERLALWEENRSKWGKQWIMLSNPTYGSWESAAFGHSYKFSREEQRQKKLDGLQGWKP